MEGVAKQDLSNYDIILLIDKSGSMGTKDMASGLSRWEAAKELTLAVARKAMEFDKDGITVIPFNSKFKRYDNINSDELVNKVFDENEPSLSTDTAGALKSVLDAYFADRKKPIIVLVVTDGTPDSETALESVIIEASKKMEQDGEIGISFLQIGNDTAATAFLKRLDDGLEAKGAKFDIVDTKTTDEMGDTSITDVILSALND